MHRIARRVAGQGRPGGLLVGGLTGMVGVGGGFRIVPALVLMRMSLRQAVGTSLLIITGTRRSS